MSTAELSAPRGDGALTAGDLLAAHARPRNGLRTWLRLLGSELRIMFRRWRNLALLGVLVVLPVILGIGLRVSMPHGGGDGGNGPGASFFAELAGNGVFLTFLALTVLALTFRATTFLHPPHDVFEHDDEIGRAHV